METYHVVLLHFASGSEMHAVVYADEGETSHNIILSIAIDGRTLISESEQYLASYQKLRDALLVLGYGLKCNGSLLNANQSAMIAGTPKIYLVYEGRQALMKDIVPIWAYCDICAFPTTEQQKAFTQSWIMSLQ